jgi:hypothetical protein
MANEQREKKDEEIIVRAPFFRRRRLETPVVDALAERVRFFGVCEKIATYSAGPIMALSLLLLLSTVTGLLTPYQFPFPPLPTVQAVFFLGILNIFSGLLLLAKE